jgi:hypothetical protein
MVAFDETSLFQRTHTSQARGGGNSGTTRQLHIGHSARILQIPQNFPVDFVELYPLHAPLPTSASDVERRKEIS